MAQASPPLQQLIHQLQESCFTLITSDSAKQLSHWFTQIRGKLLTGVILTALVLWNWQLSAAIAIGILVLVLVYLGQQGEFNRLTGMWQRLGHPSNRSLTVAVTAGGTATLSTYLAVSVWQEAGSSWMLAGLIVQAFMTLAILLLLVWQRFNADWGEPDRLERQVDCWLTELADPDPLKRLIAVRQLTRAIAQPSRSPAAVAGDIADYFRLMLNRETEPIVCRALLESLQTLNRTPQLQPGGEPCSIPLATKPARARIERHSSPSIKSS